MLATLMADLPPSSLLLTGAVVLFASGLLRGFTGYGFAIAAVPLLSLVCPPATAVPIVLVLQVLVSANGMSGAVRLCDWASVRALAIGAIVLTPLGVLALTVLPPNVVRLIIAAIVIVAVVVIGWGARPAWLLTRTSTLLFGGVAGLFNGLAGMPGPPVIAYYLASPLGSARSRASMIVLFLLTSLAALAPLAVARDLTPGIGALAVAAFPAVWVGSWAGAYLFRWSSEAVYRWTGLIVLSATAVMIALKAMAAMT